MADSEAVIVDSSGTVGSAAKTGTDNARNETKNVIKERVIIFLNFISKSPFIQNNAVKFHLAPTI